MSNRKEDHIDLTFKAQSRVPENYGLYYEPILNHSNFNIKRNLLDKTLNAPLWISSMTGGNKRGKELNISFAKAAQKFGLAMGLGSCRSIIESDERLDEFKMRSYCPDTIIFANLGIAQVYQYLKNDELHKIEKMINKIEADGLIIHINPLQEFFQPEGDAIDFSIFETIKSAVYSLKLPIIIKEVGQGMGPKSLQALLELPIYGIELASFGGTNFSKLESLRSKSHNEYNPMIRAGHTAEDMIDWIKKCTINPSLKTIIISGGIENMLHGHSLIERLNMPNIQTFIGQASAYLSKALEGDQVLEEFLNEQVNTYKVASEYMRFHE